MSSKQDKESRTWDNKDVIKVKLLIPEASNYYTDKMELSDGKLIIVSTK